MNRTCRVCKGSYKILNDYTVSTHKGRDGGNCAGSKRSYLTDSEMALEAATQRRESLERSVAWDVDAKVVEARDNAAKRLEEQRACVVSKLSDATSVATWEIARLVRRELICKLWEEVVHYSTRTRDGETLPMGMRAALRYGIEQAQSRLLSRSDVSHSSSAWANAAHDEQGEGRREWFEEASRVAAYYSMQDNAREELAKLLVEGK